MRARPYGSRHDRHRALGQALAGALFGVTPADPIAIGAASLVLVVTAAAACYVPARRASRLDPVQALREG